jgi:hypothetical protein
MYVEDETEPVVCLFEFRPRLMAPPTTKKYQVSISPEAG